MKLFALAAAVIGTAWARCNNDCSGNGICNAGSVCECELNFLGNDCSDRLCLYGKAFVDSPLGDINSNSLMDTDQQIQYQYANGLVGEQYDNAYGLARDINEDPWNEAHFYRECSNKGVCDRSTGQCACFPGFEGEGCRRITCPNDCSNHGQCVNMVVSNSAFKAWDQKKTVECQCDPGFTGADCSLRKCPQGSDPISTVYTNDNSVYKIEWGQKTNAWVHGPTGEEIPNGQVHWTISYKDDYGDIWTTSAVTTYYQARTAAGSLEVGPQVAGDIVTTPFFMNPDYQGSEVEVVNVDGDLSAGTDVTAVYSDPNSAVTALYSFHPSFIGEQVNASIQALPNDVVRHSYVHTVFNYGKDADQVFIYPSMGVPKFNTVVTATGTLATGVAGVDFGVVFKNGAGHCSPDAPDASCANAGNFNKGKSLAVNNQMYRFPYWVDADDATTGVDAVAAAYTNCAKNALCIFITIPEPEGTKAMTVNYKFKTLIRAVKTGVTESAMKPADYTESWTREKSNYADGAKSIVTVAEVGSARKWNKLVDGTPIIEFKSRDGLHDCSRRGLCDFETGACKCFDGYSGYKCQERSVLGY